MIRIVLKILNFFYHSFSFKRKVQFYCVIIFTVIATFLEILTIGSVVPFVEVIMNFNNYNNSKYIGMIPILKNISEEFFIFIFISFVIISGIWRISLLYINSRFAEAFVADTSSKIFFNELSKPFNRHLERNNAEFISVVTEKMSSFFTVLSSMLNIISASIILFILILIFLIVTPIGFTFPIIILFIL